MRKENLDALAEIASGDTDRVLSCIVRNVEHPEAIAHDLGLSRTTVESRLSGLVRVGVLERYTVPSQGPRPKYLYRLTDDSRKFLEDIEATIETHWRRLAETHRAEIDGLEEKFLKGTIPEEEFRRLRRVVDEKYGNFRGIRPA